MFIHDNLNPGDMVEVEQLLTNRSFVGIFVGYHRDKRGRWFMDLTDSATGKSRRCITQQHNFEHVEAAS